MSLRSTLSIEITDMTETSKNFAGKGNGNFKILFNKSSSGYVSEKDLLNRFLKFSIPMAGKFLKVSLKCLQYRQIGVLIVSPPM